MLRAAILALDGVLVDLAPARAAAFGDALAAEGVAAAPTALARAARLAADAGGEAALRAVLAELGAVDETTLALVAHRGERLLASQLRSAGLALAPGASAAVAALGARLRLAVVSTLPRADVQHVLDTAGLAPAFGVVIAGDDRAAAAGPSAAWPAAAARLAARLPGLVPAGVAALAAGPAGAAAARAAGLRAVRVGPADAQSDVAVDDAAGAHARLRTLDGLTPAALACALDLPPHPAPTASSR